MNKLIYLLLTVALFSGCNTTKDSGMNEGNPFYSEYDTPFGVPPFDLIETEHFLPAFKQGIKNQEMEVDAIINNQKPASFENTFAALDESGTLLKKVNAVFNNMMSCNTNEELQAVAKEISPLISQHSDNIRLNPDLFAKVKAVYGQKDDLDLTPEQNRLLEETHKTFVRGGANLSPEDQEKIREINKKLSLLSLQFGENVLAETNEFEMVIENEAGLAGLPEVVINSAYKETGEGKPAWAFTLHKPSLIPFLQYADNRTLREKIFKGYINRGDNQNENDNKDIVAEIVNLRVEKAHLLGYKSHAGYILDNNMAKTPETVYSFMNEIMDAALPVARTEAVDLQKMIDAGEGGFKLEPWDWWYYSEKLRKEKYDLDEESIRPYFELETVRNGLFEVVNKLYGLKVRVLENLPKPHEDAQAFEVLEADGSHVGILYMDFHPRASKRGGAWMSSYRKQYVKDGETVTPVITTVFNFTSPSGDDPALLSFEEVSTMYHEFGHALHGLLSKCTYQGLSGTSVSRDFVELPSQIMENWAASPEVIRSYGKHFETGEAIPDELVEKLQKSSHFNQGFIIVEYLSAAFLDMDWHALEEPTDMGVNEFEKISMDHAGLIPEIVVRYRSPYFSHIFAGGYSAGYYSYIWAEVLDADAFEAFKATGDIFDQTTAASFRKNILEKGGTEDPMELYLRFRGSKPDIIPLLKKRGLR